MQIRALHTVDHNGRAGQRHHRPCRLGRNTAAIPAGTAVGTITTGHYIILFPKLAPSWDRKPSAAVTAAPTAVAADSVRSNRLVRIVSTATATARAPRPVTAHPYL